MQIKKEFTIDCAHRLMNYEGKCHNVHGHTYKIVLYIEGEMQDEGNERGMVSDFGTVKNNIVSRFMENWDHTYIGEEGDEVLEFLRENGYNTYTFHQRPTAEYMAKFIVKLFYSHGVVGAEVYETPTNSALYFK